MMKQLIARLFLSALVRGDQPGEIFSFEGDTYKLFQWTNDSMVALSTTGIVQDEYVIYQHGVNTYGSGQALTTVELAAQGIYIIDLETARMARKAIEATQSAIQARTPSEYDSGTSAGYDYDTPTGSDYDTPDGSNDPDLRSCSIGRFCVAPGAAFCQYYFYAASNYVYSRWPSKETWTALTKHPFFANVASASLGLAGGATIYHVTKGSGNDPPAANCQQAQGQLATALARVNDVCHAYATSENTCIHACAGYLYDGNTYDQVYINVNKQGYACSTQPPCGTTCRS